MLRHLFLAFAMTYCALMPARADQSLTVFAAASLREAMETVGEAYERKTGTAPVFSFAGTGTLARQIEAGAPADVFISADAEWMDYVRGAGAVDEGSIQEFASNELVLIGSKDGPPLTVSTEGIEAYLGGQRLAMADPETVPAGRYGRAALDALGLWQTVAGSLAPMENVRVALTAVARGDTPLGLVYKTDALVEPAVDILFPLPRESHPPIRYLSAVTKANEDGPARTFSDFLTGPEAQEILRSFGFVADNG